MLRSIEQLRGLELVGTDDTVGKAVDFYFDDERWTVRYLVARAGGWLRNKRVLLSPLAIHRADWEHARLLLKLSREQVERSPDIDADKPISRQQEEAYHRHYGWAGYWGVNTDIWGPFGLPGALARMPFNEPAGELEREARERMQRESNPHLRSCKEVLGYHLQARNDELGHVSDFIVDDESWALRYLVVGTRHGWFGGKHVLVGTHWVERVSWTERRVFVDLPHEAVQTSPEWNPDLPITRAYEEQLHAHYARQGYWRPGDEAGAGALPNRPYPTDHDVHPGMR